MTTTKLSWDASVRWFLMYSCSPRHPSQGLLTTGTEDKQRPFSRIFHVQTLKLKGSQYIRCIRVFHDIYIVSLQCIICSCNSAEDRMCEMLLSTVLLFVPSFFSKYKSSNLLCVPPCQWCIMSRLPPALSPAANLQPSLTFGLIKGNSSLPNWCCLLFQPWRSEVRKKKQTDGFGHCWPIGHL